MSIHELALEAEVADVSPKNPDQLNPGLAFAAPRGSIQDEKGHRDSETAYSETSNDEEPTDLGKYKTLIIFACVYIAGLLILVLTSLSVALENGVGMGGFVAAILVIGIGTGGIKSNVPPLLADQYQRKKMAVKTIVKTSELVIIDPAVTIQRIYLIFYCCINIGALSLLATPTWNVIMDSGQHICSASVCFIVGFNALVLGQKTYMVRPPQ
ncbi:POT family-domain-containing protein [Leptodontidium sp. MPI-SDFR-AT-0119]|nr:POT family-domain-containing protein [Leptodontidium sp. MPI-SDFR-AT-0119]